MHMPSVVGRVIEWEDGGKKFLLAPVDFDMELAFQERMEADARRRLPKPGDPDRPDMLKVHKDEVDANEFAYNGSKFRRLLCTFAGQATYLHFLMACGYQKSGGTAAPTPPVRDVERRLRDETEAIAAAEKAGAPAPAAPLTELWLEVLSRDFPFARTPAAPAPATTATPAPTTPA
jgi:hypothetical protein